MENHRGILLIDVTGRAILGIALLLLYFVGHVGTVGYHHLAHAWDSHAHHTHTEESDPCHRAIYHAEEDACDHPTHLGEEEDICTYCQFAFGQQSEPEQVAVTATRPLPTALVLPVYSTTYRSSILGTQPPRGPPHDLS